MLPNMSEVLDEWSIAIKAKTVTRSTIDFVEVERVAVRTINAVVQVAQKDSLKSDQIDWSLKYLTIHTISALDNGELIEYGSEDYKIIDNGNWSLYGYTEALLEQTKKAIKVQTYDLVYLAGAGGTIVGSASQVVVSGGNGSQVTATPSTGFVFTSWSDGVLTASRTDTAVIANKTITATFGAIP